VGRRHRSDSGWSLLSGAADERDKREKETAMPGETGRPSCPGLDLRGRGIASFEGQIR